MGTEERDWVEVANDLLYKCHVNLRLKRLTDCDANVFVALYEAILSDKVPDYIAVPRSQEDDIHNVQSVIDSLALDYLHISLSHITGENVVRGDGESVRNLLEIFDGLLEYLTEQLSEDEELQNGALQPNGELHRTGPQAARPGEREREDMSQASSAQSVIQSSKHSVHSWNGDESESTAELIRLGDSARTFTKKEVVPPAPGAPSQGPDALFGAQAVPAGAPLATATTGGTQATLLREPLRSAIPLQPPFQTTPQRSGTIAAAAALSLSPRSATLSPASGSASLRAPERLQQQQQEPGVATALQNGHSLRPTGDGLRSGHLLSPSSPRSPVTSERSSSSQRRANGESGHQPARTATSGPRRVLFRTEPEVLLMSLREELEGGGALHNGHPEEVRVNGETRHQEQEEEVLQLSSSSSSSRRREHGRGARDRGLHRSERRNPSEASRSPGHPEPLSSRSQRNRKAEQELHDMSEKLARRLEELDHMLKRALGESGEEPDPRHHHDDHDDRHSHHSDSVMETRRTARATDVPLTNGVTRSLSPSPPPPTRRPLPTQLDQAVAAAAGHDSAHHMARTRRRELRQLHSQRRRGQMVGAAYEEELKRYEDEERADMAKERLRIQETEREYREALRKESPRSPKSADAGSPKASGSPSSSRVKHTSSGRKQAQLRKATPMKLKENDLLPTLLEEFPGLQVSPHTLGHMWKQQLRQVDHLNASENQRSHFKLANQVEDAKKRHDMLVEIIRKEQEHNRRLKDQRERVQQQKSTQNKLREQRQQVARAKKYYGDYHLQLRSRLARARTREERLFKQMFQEGVELQKARLREQRAYAKEQRQEHQRQHRTELEAMENYYKDQMSLLAETLAQERQEIQVRKKAQEKALHKLKRELRNKMEREIGELQRIIIQNDEDDYFRDLEAERLRSRLQMASFQYNTSCLH
ncbi:centrosomal protein of 95 kDa-like isoform X2 [Sardina pilchardus]|uniref:centrosomal protein of 95 kDa-like isoform X2 n=1 Tax=Sardina pilchardus TaxID=27697 RepID=UPI002E0F2FAD